MYHARDDATATRFTHILADGVFYFAPSSAWCEGIASCRITRQGCRTPTPPQSPLKRTSSSRSRESGAAMLRLLEAAGRLYPRWIFARLSLRRPLSRGLIADSHHEW